MASLSATARDTGPSHSKRRRPRRRLSTSHVLIGVVAVLAFVLNLLVLQDRGSTVLVAVADRHIAEGSALTADSLRLVPVDADFDALESMVLEEHISDFEGWIATRSLEAGDLVLNSEIIEPGMTSGMRTMSLPVDPEHAAGGSLVVGDRIDVISVVDGDARFVVANVRVTGVAASESGSFSSSSYYVVVGVEGHQALLLAKALEDGPLEVIRATGAPKVQEGAGIGDS